MLHKPVRLSITALTRMMATQRLGPPHLAIKAAPMYMNLEADREADAEMWADFKALDLVDRRSRLDGDALDSLSLLARPANEYFAHFIENGRRFSALVASGSTDGEAVLAFRDGDTVELRSLRQESLPETLLRQLPDAPAARVESLNVRLEDLRHGGGSGHGAQDIYKFKRLTDEPITGQGELYVGVRDYYGEYSSNQDNPLRYEDRASGRVIVTLSRGGYLSVAPATKRLLLDRLNEARRDVAG
jgi:hypothetical protein